MLGRAVEVAGQKRVVWDEGWELLEELSIVVAVEEEGGRWDEEDGEEPRVWLMAVRKETVAVEVGGRAGGFVAETFALEAGEGTRFGTMRLEGGAVERVSDGVEEGMVVG